MTLFWIVLAITLFFLSALTCLFVYYLKKGIEEVKKGKRDAYLIYGEHLEEEKEKNPTSRRMRKIAGILLDVLVVVLSVFFLLSLTARLINAVHLPYETMVVVTGSMSVKNESNDYLFENNLDDQIQVNDMIAVRRVDSLEEVKLYDIVCYVDEEGRQIVHRVIEKKEDSLVTRGDANDTSDPTMVTIENLVGVYTHFRIPKLGILVLFVQSNYGILAFCGILYVLLFYDQCMRIQGKNEEARRKTLVERIQGAKEYTIVSEFGTLTVKDDQFEYGEENEHKGDSYLLINKERIALPESE